MRVPPVEEIPLDILEDMHKYSHEPYRRRQVEVRSYINLSFNSMLATSFLNSIQEEFSKIPKEYLDSCFVDIDEDRNLSLVYHRKETDEEINERVEHYYWGVLRERERERRLYKTLKKKFEGDS